MAAYKYIAFDASGRRLTGIVDADSSRAARLLLGDRGLIPLEASDLALSRGASKGSRFTRLRESELCLVTRQWATLLASGLTMEQALSALIEQAERDAVREVLGGVRAEILGGHSLHTALDLYAIHFPIIYRASVAAGEKSGDLSNVMMHLADHLERRNALRQKTLQALLYPAIVAVVALIVVISLMTYVMPSVVAVFQQGKQTLPWLTRIMMGVSAILTNWGWLLAAVLAVFVAFMRFALRAEEFRRRCDALLLRAPVCGRYLRTLEATRFASTLSILIGSGVPLLVALDAGRRVIGRLPLQDAVATAADRVREGKPLARALGQTGQFPPLLIHMIASGEATGQLHVMLERAARLQQADLENRTVVMTTLMEPLLLLLMGGVVLAIVLAVMQPIIELNQLFR
jgi:general secretion pathway protein F